MTAEQKARWIEALRSDEYKQGQMYLMYPTSYPAGKRYCCLGVYAELNELLGVDHEGYGYTQLESGAKSNCYLPDSVLPIDTQQTLALMNDEQEVSFNQIADWIETHIKTPEEEEYYDSLSTEL
jgi:hypothetical protein